MNFSGFSHSPPTAGAASSPSRSPSSRSAFSDLSNVSPKVALAGFSALEVSPNPNGAMTSTIKSLALGGFTTPTKPSRSAAAASLTPKAKSTSKKSAPKFASLSLGPEPTQKTPKSSSKTGSPKKRVNLTSGVSIMSLSRERSTSPRKTPSPRKLTLAEDASFLSANASTPKRVYDLSPSKSSPTKSSFRTTKTPSPKKVSFADEASFLSASGSTPKSPIGLSPKASPAQPEVSEFSVMSVTSPAASQVSQDLSPVSHTSRPEEEEQTESVPETPSKILAVEDEDDNNSVVDSPSKVIEPYVALQSPSKASEASSMFQSPSKLDVSMHDVTWMSDYNGAYTSPFPTYTFATAELTDAAKSLTGPFQPELFEQADYTCALAAPRFSTSVLQQKQVRNARRKKQQQRSKRQEIQSIEVQKAITHQVSESLLLDELEAAPQFRVIAARGKLSYAICTRKKQRVSEETNDDDAVWYEGEDDGIALLIEARRVVRNELFHVPMGPTVQEMRHQYHADVQKYGAVLRPTHGKRNYNGEPKRAYNNDLLTHSIMQPLLSFPMPDLTFEFVLQHAISESDKAHGRPRQRTRNVRQPIAIYGEPEVSNIEEEDEPQSPTPALPRLPSTATHQSNASRKLRLDQGAINLRAKLAALASIPEPISPVAAEPLSSPIGPGFTFECPSFVSTPGNTRTIHDITEDAEPAEEDAQDPDNVPELVASPMVVFKNRTPGATSEAPFKRRRSLPAARRLSFSGPLRRASLPLATGSDQLSLVQDLEEDPASESLAIAPTPMVELPAVHNPLEVDLASLAETQASPAPAEGASSIGSSSPASVVVDVRENPDIFGSSQDRPGSPIQALASLTRVFEETKEMQDGKVVVSRENGRLIVRFKVSDEHAALFAAESAPASPVVPAEAIEDNESAPISPVVLPASPSLAPVIPALLGLSENDVVVETAEEEEEEEEEEENDDEDKVDEEEEVMQVPTLDLPEDDSDLAMLRSFVSRHAASRAARAAETTEPAALSPLPTAPIRLAATPERLRQPQGIWADTPNFTPSSADRSRRLASPAVSSAARQPLGALDTNSPSPRKVKRKSEEIEEQGASPEKQSAKKPRKAKAEKENNVGKPEKEEKPMKEKDEDKSKDVVPESSSGPAAGVRTRAQRAAERGEAPPATKIPMRHQVYAKVRNGEKDVATVTRQNTRANKGGALSVDEVLAQLKDGAPAGIETRAAAAARKDGKTVQWAEQLARSQSEEPPVYSRSPSPLSPAEEKEVGKVTKARKAASTPKKAASSAAATKTAGTKAAAAAATKSTTKAKTATPSKLRQPRASAAAAGPKTEGAKVAKKVTPATKKELGLSANGTPAPAKRSRRIAEKK